MLGNPGLGVERAGVLAARQVARELREERQRQRQARQASSNSPLSVANATQHLISRLRQIFERHLEAEAPRTPLPHTSDHAPRGEL
jgi:hypothetical protein